MEEEELLLPPPPKKVSSKVVEEDFLLPPPPKKEKAVPSFSTDISNTNTLPVMKDSPLQANVAEVVAEKPVKTDVSIGKPKNLAEFNRLYGTGYSNLATGEKINFANVDEKTRKDNTPLTAVEVMQLNNKIRLERLEVTKAKIEKLKELNEFKRQAPEIEKNIEQLSLIVSDEAQPYETRLAAQTELKGIEEIYKNAGLEVQKLNDLNEIDKTLTNRINTNESVRQQRLENEYNRWQNLAESTGKALVKLPSQLLNMSAAIANLGESINNPEMAMAKKETLRKALKPIEDFADGLVNQETPDNYKDWFDGKFSAGKLGYLASEAIGQTLPTVAAGFLTGGVGSVVTGSAMAFDESRNILLEAGLTPNQADAGALGLAVPLGLLEKYGIEDIIKKPIGKKILKETAQEVIGKLGKEITKANVEEIFSVTKKTVGALIKKYGSEVLGAAWKEPITEMAQAGVNELGKQVAEAYSGKDSNAKQSTADYLRETGKSILSEGLSGALGGVGISSVASALQSRTNPSAYDRALELKDQDLYEDFVAQMQEEVGKGIITEEQMALAESNVKKIQEADAKIPKNIIGAERRSVAAALITKKEELEAEIEGKDKVLVAPIIEEIKNIDQTLGEIAQGLPIEEIEAANAEQEIVPATETPAAPISGVSGEVQESGDVELKNEGKADAPTKENIDERLRINHPFYKKVEDALFKLGIIEKYNPETGTGDVLGGYSQEITGGGFSVGKFIFSKDGSISYITSKGTVRFDKNGNVISENTKEVAEKEKQIEIESKKKNISSLEQTRDSEAFKYKEVTESDVIGNKKKVKRLKTVQELKESTDKINAAIDKAKAELKELEPITTNEQQNDKENGTGIQSNIGEGQEPVKTQPIETTGGKKVEAGGNVQTYEKEIADLRAKEQAEYAALKNPTKEAKKKIYDKYDKLITPLLEASKAEPTEPSKSNKNYQDAQEANSIISKENPDASVLLQPKGEDLSLTAVYVGKEKRGKGIGSKVLESVKKQADRLGKKVVLDATNELDSKTDLERLGRFYERNGFTKVSENKYEYSPSKKETVEVAPKEGDTSTTKSARGMIQNMVFKDGEWQIKFGKDFTKVAKTAQQEAQDAFNEKNAPVAEVKEQAPVVENVPVEKTTSVYVAPFYDAMVKTTEEANDVEKSPAYKKYVQTINSVAEALGIKIKSLATNIGAYTNDDGVKVREVSTKVELETTNIDEATEFAVLMGALAPEVQESTIAAQGLSKEDVGTKKHTGNLIVVKVDNLEEAIAIAKEIGLDHTINLKENTIDFIAFNYFSKNAKELFKRNLGRFAIKIKEKGINYETKSKPIESRFIQSGADPKSDFGRKDVLERMAGLLERANGDNGSDMGLLGRRKMLRDALQEATRRNNEFIRQQELASERAEYGKLRAKQIELEKKGERLSDEEVKRFTELLNILIPSTQETVRNASEDYEEARKELEKVAAKVIGDLGFLSTFGIKRAERAATKILRWYQGKAQWLGDGARTNLIVYNEKDVMVLYKKLQAQYKGGIIRTEKDDTGLGYPKRLLEVRASNGKIAEFQVMTPEGYLAKDGVNGFPKEQMDFAAKELSKIQKRLGWLIPDGVGHYFYEIERDFNVPTDLRERAKAISLKYYDAFLKADSKYTEKEFLDEISQFKKDVDAADKTNWDKGNNGISPVTVNDFIEDTNNQYEPISVSDTSHETFTKDNAVDYEEGEKYGDNGRSYAYLASVTVELIDDVSGDSIGTISKLKDEDGEITWNAEDTDGNEVIENAGSKNAAQQALVDNYNKQKLKEFNKEKAKAAKEKIKEAEKAKQKAEKEAAKAAKAAEKAVKKSKPEQIGAGLLDLLGLAPETDVKFSKVSVGEINWSESRIGRGDRAITERNENVKNAAEDLYQGRIGLDEYNDTVDENSPTKPITEFIEPAKEEDIRVAVGDKSEGKINLDFPEGKKVGLRLDIPAYINKNIWAITVHEDGKTGSPLSYNSVARIKNVKFTSDPSVALDIARHKELSSGKKMGKATIARMMGEWIPIEGDTNEAKAKSAMKMVEEIKDNPEWAQIGMNPFRHSFFYDRATGNPVVAAEELIQIGGLVYAKNIETASKNDERFIVNDAKGNPIIGKEGKAVRFSKKEASDKAILSEVEQEQEIVDQMNKMNLVNDGIDLNPSFTTKETIDVTELNSRLNTPLKAVNWAQFKGIPFGFTISDQLTTGDVKLPSTGATIDNLKGGIGFNGTKGNENNAWANTDLSSSASMYSKALEMYNNNKPLFEKLWKEGKLPAGHVPFAVVKMAETSIISNEAIRRVGIENLKNLPKENRKEAVAALKSELERKRKQEAEDLVRGTRLKKVKGTPKGVTEYIDTKIPYSKNTEKAKDKIIKQYESILASLDKNNYEDIVDVLKNTDDFTLPAKAVIFNEIFYGDPNKIGQPSKNPGTPSTLVSQTLVKGLDKSKRRLISIGVITDLITEPSMKNVPNMHVISIIGVKVAEQNEKGEWVKAGGSTTVDHPNYKHGVEGKSIGVLTNPVHMKDAFGEAYGSVLGQIVKNEAENASISIDNLLAQGIPVQAGLPNLVLKSAIASGELDAVDKLAGFLRQAFPSTTFFTSEDAWDAAMEDPSVKKKLKDGDVVYAFTTNGNVFINPTLKTTKATLHETGHIWMSFVKENNPALYAKGLQLVTNTREHQKAIKEYGDTELAREEALMELMSSKGDTIVRASDRAKFKEWLLSVYKYVADNFTSLLGLNPKQIENLTLDKFLEGMLADILSGKKVTTKKVKAEKEVKFSLESQNSKIRDYIESQRKAGESDRDIRAGVEMVADKLGLTKEDINNLMSENEPTITEEAEFTPNAKDIAAFSKILATKSGAIRNKNIAEAVKVNPKIQEIMDNFEDLKKQLMASVELTTDCSW